MELIADALLIAGAAGAALYCRTLGIRLNRLKDLDSGLGAAIAALSRQVDDLRASLEAAKDIGGDQKREIAQLSARAEMAAGRLELLLASLHEGGRRKPGASGEAAKRRSRLFDDEDDDDATGGTGRDETESSALSRDSFEAERRDALARAAAAGGRRRRATGGGVPALDEEDDG